jgi:hypothetical protein
MARAAIEPGIREVVCNEDLWYLRLGARLGLYKRDLTHSTVQTRIMAVPRAEVEYWRARLAEFRAGTLAPGPARGMLLHEEIHARQMHGKPFWLWGLRYVLSRRFRRRIEEEAYTAHLIHLAGCGLALEAPYWTEHFQQLYFGAFNAAQARAMFERIAAAVRKEFPAARITETAQGDPGGPAYLPWLAECAGGGSGGEEDG